MTSTNIPQRPSADKAVSHLTLLSYSYFTFICYLSIGLPLAVLPSFVHFNLGYSTVIAGLVISIQYIASLVSRPWVGHFCDKRGAKLAVLSGLFISSISGALLIGAAYCLKFSPLVGLLVLLVGRLILGISESLTSTGSTLWSIASNGSHHTARIIGYNGVSTYGAMAAGAPLGVWIYSQWGLNGIGSLVLVLSLFSLIFAARKANAPIIHGEPLPIRDIFKRVLPHGLALALSGIGFSELATFGTLYYVSKHWQGAALCLTAFGIAFVLTRIFFIHTISLFGSLPVAKVIHVIEFAGLLILWLATNPWVALLGAAITGFGFSLVFPALGVDAVKRVPLQNRGAALGIFTGFADISFFLTGPTSGAIMGWYGYGSIFVFAMIAVALSLAIVYWLAHNEKLQTLSA